MMLVRSGTESGTKSKLDACYNEEDWPTCIGRKGADGNELAVLSNTGHKSAIDKSTATSSSSDFCHLDRRSGLQLR